jgi:hypothetical protein
MHHTLLLKVLISLRLPELNDVVLPLATGIFNISAFLKVLLAGHACGRLHDGELIKPSSCAGLDC